MVSCLPIKVLRDLDLDAAVGRMQTAQHTPQQREIVASATMIPLFAIVTVAPVAMATVFATTAAGGIWVR
jgi:hypothetical protein